MTKFELCCLKNEDENDDDDEKKQQKNPDETAFNVERWS